MVSQGKTSPATAKAKPRRSGNIHAAAASQPKNHQPVNNKSASLSPVVVDAGSTSKSSLRHLEQGTGPLVHEIGQIVHAVHAAVPEPGSIVIVYREKRSRSSLSASPFDLVPLLEELLPI
jgi:hypothetical protein